MKTFKVFVQAVRLDKAGEEERMFVYEVEATDMATATSRGKARFEFEEGLNGWTAAGAGSLEM